MRNPPSFYSFEKLLPRNLNRILTFRRYDHLEYIGKELAKIRSLVLPMWSASTP